MGSQLSACRVWVLDEGWPVAKIGPTGSRSALTPTRPAGPAVIAGLLTSRACVDLVTTSVLGDNRPDQSRNAALRQISACDTGTVDITTAVLTRWLSELNRDDTFRGKTEAHTLPNDAFVRQLGRIAIRQGFRKILALRSAQPDANLNVLKR
ncbi:hypothetical protein [Sciscionella sediminilitoris]|uniref:hypothetical protein n=1 Tax=Sciscionella sediminilitoris TaxID=1445613 RepID=UPI0012E18A8F|nr:hypothetical protein [Sciscionella sp. SE31]